MWHIRGFRVIMVIRIFSSSVSPEITMVIRAIRIIRVIRVIRVIRIIRVIR